MNWSRHQCVAMKCCYQLEFLAFLMVEPFCCCMLSKQLISNWWGHKYTTAGVTFLHNVIRRWDICCSIHIAWTFRYLPTNWNDPRFHLTFQKSVSTKKNQYQWFCWMYSYWSFVGGKIHSNSMGNTLLNQKEPGNDLYTCSQHSFIGAATAFGWRHYYSHTKYGWCQMKTFFVALSFDWASLETEFLLSWKNCIGHRRNWIWHRTN